MGDGFQFLDIVLFAMVAAFLVLRLRSVLGKRTGHQQPRQDHLSQPNDEVEGAANVTDRPDHSRDISSDPTANLDPSDPLTRGIEKIRSADETFDPAEFADGARGAFEMIVKGFAEGDKRNLEFLLADDVYDNFEAAIDERDKAEETLESTIIGIKVADVIEADMDGAHALVTIKFVSEQVNLTRDSEDRVINGDPNEISEITDIWTFSRDTKSSDPNWRLVETRSQI